MAVFSKAVVFGTLNVRSLWDKNGDQYARIQLIAQQAAECGLRLVGVQEARWPGSGQQRIPSTSYQSLHSGDTSKHQKRLHGVMLIMDSVMSASLVDWKPISDRLLRARFRLARRAHLSVLLCYAPTNTPCDAAPAVGFYQELHSELSALPRRDAVVVLGDFNARVGTDADGAWRGVIGRFGGDRFAAERGQDGSWRYQPVECLPNANGKRLLDLAAQQGLVLANTCFEHKGVHLHTFDSDAQTRRCTLDYILVSKRYMSGVRDARVYRQFDVLSDHRLLVASFRFRLCAPQRRGAAHGGAARPALWRLGEEEVRKAFETGTAARLRAADGVFASGDVEAAWAAFCSSITSAVWEAAGSQREVRYIPRCFSARTRRLVNAKIVAFVLVQQSSIGAEQRAGRKRHYRQLCRAVTASVQADRQRELRRQAEQAQTHWQGRDYSRFFRTVRRMDPLLVCADARGLEAGLLSADGQQLLRSPEAILQRLSNHFGSLLVQGAEVSDDMLAALVAMEAAVTEPATPAAASRSSNSSPPSPPPAPQPSQRATPASPAGGGARLLRAFTAVALGGSPARDEAAAPQGGVQTRAQRARAQQQQQLRQQQPSPPPRNAVQPTPASRSLLSSPLPPGPRQTSPADPSPRRRPPPEPPPRGALSVEQMVAEPTLGEVEGMVVCLRNAAAPGEDGITAPMLKASSTSINYLHRLICLVWQQRKAPMQWKHALLVPLYKGKGDKRVCDNLRGISLLSIPGKAYAALLLRRLSQHLYSQLHEAQCGFVPGRGLTDASFVLQHLMSQSWEFAVPLYLAFIDLRKAFDSVPRDVLWQVLRAYGVPPLLVELVSDLHTGTLAAVRLGSQKGEPFSVSCGVRQGCIIAPLLFNVFIDFVVRQALARMPSTCGVSFALRANGAPLPGSAAGDPSVPIPLLMYADDMALTCSSPLELTHFLGVMDDVCAECGLCINASKTEVMAVGREGRTPPLPPIVLRGGPVKEVPRFKYLGSLISANATCEAEINARIAKAGAAFHSLKYVWDSPLGVGLKSVVYITCVRTILLFGGECWAPTAALESRLNTFHNRCLRRIVRVSRSDRHSSTYLYDRCAEHSIPTHLSVLRLRQLGHVARMLSTRYPKLALGCRPPPTIAPQPSAVPADTADAPRRLVRPGGRPRTRWFSIVDRDLAALAVSLGVSVSRLESLLLDRTEWRKAILSLLPRKREF